MNVECAQPLREGASSSGIDVFPNVEHGSIITYTLASTVDSGNAACTSRATMTVSFSGITRPVPAPVLDLPTVSCFLWTRSIRHHRSLRSSLSRSPQFRSTDMRAYFNKSSGSTAVPCHQCFPGPS
jgi:hypothetical protein